MIILIFFSEVQHRRDRNIVPFQTPPLTPSTPVLDNIKQGYEFFTTSQKAVFASQQPNFIMQNISLPAYLPLSAKIEMEYGSIPSLYLMLNKYFSEFEQLDKEIKVKGYFYIVFQF